MRTNADVAHVKGLVVADASRRLVAALGVGSDPRVKAMVSDPQWLAEALQKRMTPLLLARQNYVVFAKEIDEGVFVLISETPTETVMNFLLNVDFAYDILDHVLTDPYDAMAIVDAQAKLAFIAPVHERFFGLKTGEGIGKDVRDVIENTRLDHVVKTGVAEVGLIHRMRGLDRIVSRHPIRHEGKTVGAIGRIMFKGPQQVEALARRVKALEEEIETYKQATQVKLRGEEYLDAIVGRSAAIQSVREQIRKIAPLDIPVLIQGESGTGKELVAKALHMLSPRQDGRLVTVNAAALPQTLVESELFGYEAGSFTGADRKGRPGKFEMADKGTMFLDEIGDMPIDTQSKLLRVLQDRIVERVGGDKPKRVDFRLCSATNRDLEEFIENGRFRLDLYYRISPVQIVLPALRDRLEDIPLLVAHFLTALARQYNRPVPEIDPSLLDYLMERDWPGNVRQLQHQIESAFIFAEHGRLRVSDFQKYAAAAPPSRAKKFEPPEVASEGSLKGSLEKVENDLIRDTLLRLKGNKKKAAEQLGISRSYLYKKLEELGL